MCKVHTVAGKARKGHSPVPAYWPQATPNKASFTEDLPKNKPCLQANL